MKYHMLAAAAITTLAASASASWAVTYQLLGSTLETCTFALYSGNVTPRACTAQEREMYKPTDGYTFDGRIHINESRLRDFLDIATGSDPTVMPTGTLANANIPPIDITNNDAFSFDLANIVPFAEDYFALTTDGAKRPLSWEFELDANAPDYPGPVNHPEGIFNGPDGIASYTKIVGSVSEGPLVVNWTGQGGKLSVVPLPAGAPLLLAGLALFGVVSLGRRRGA